MGDYKSLAQIVCIGGTSMELHRFCSQQTIQNLSFFPQFRAENWHSVHMTWLKIHLHWSNFFFDHCCYSMWTLNWIRYAPCRNFSNCCPFYWSSYRVSNLESMSPSLSLSCHYKLTLMNYEHICTTFTFVSEMRYSSLLLTAGRVSLRGSSSSASSASWATRREFPWRMWPQPVSSIQEIWSIHYKK